MPERHLGAGSSSATSRSDAACLTCVDGVIAGFRTPRPGIRSDYRPVHSLCVYLCAVRRLVVIELVTGITCPAARATMQAAARPRLRGSGQSSDCFVCLEPDAGRPCLRARPAAAGLPRRLRRELAQFSSAQSALLNDSPAVLHAQSTSSMTCRAVRRCVFPSVASRYWPPVLPVTAPSAPWFSSPRRYVS